MHRRLRVLILEDQPSDADLMTHQLRRHGFDPVATRVVTEKEYRSALSDSPDLILAGDAHAQFDSRQALGLLRESGRDIPFLMVSGTIGEELVAAMMKQGASDCLLKDRLAHLGAAVERALAERNLRLEKHQAEEALRHSEEQYRTLVEGAIEGLVIIQDGVIQFANRAAAQMAGCPDAKDLIGCRVWETLVPPEFRSELQARCAACLAGEVQPVHKGWGGVRRDGNRIWLQSTVSRVIWQRRPAILAYLCDITEQRESEERLRASEERFSKAFHGSPVPLSIVTLKEGRYLDVNASLEQMVGLKRDEMIGRTGLDLGFWADAAEHRAFAERVLREARVDAFPARMRVRSGEWRDVLISAESIELGAERCVILVAEDITERKRAEVSLRESEERFRQLAENIDDVFWIMAPDHSQVVYVSPAYEAIWGRSCHSLYEFPHSWLDGVHPEDREMLRHEEFSRAGRNRVYRIVRPDGAIRWIRDRAFPVRGPSGEIDRVAGIAEDVTEQRSLEEQFLQAQKMEAIGQLAGGVAHDFNNLLTIIQGHAALIQGESIPDPIRDSAQEILLASERAAALTRQLLAFSRRQVMQPRGLDINEVIERTGKMLRRTVGEDVELNLRYAPNLPLVQADAGMIEQVLMNLAVNSRDAMPKGGCLTIATRAQEHDALSLPEGPDVPSGPGVCISVTDTGCGIPPENLDRVFEPFFTTKGVGKGTGLGLATAYGIIKQHRGSIHVTSAVGQGTTFHIFLPASAEGPAESPQSRAPVRAGGEHILLVEDESALRLLVRNVLDREGYRVFEAVSGKAALSVWQREKAHIDLVLTDMVMPDGVTGRELAERLRRDAPDLKVIFSSGYSPEVVGTDLVLKEGVNFLQKPYDPGLLARTIRSCLDGK